MKNMRLGIVVCGSLIAGSSTIAQDGGGKCAHDKGSTCYESGGEWCQGSVEVCPEGWSAQREECDDFMVVKYHLEAEVQCKVYEGAVSAECGYDPEGYDPVGCYPNVLTHECCYIEEGQTGSDGTREATGIIFVTETDVCPHCP